MLETIKRHFRLFWARQTGRLAWHENHISIADVMWAIETVRYGKKRMSLAEVVSRQTGAPMKVSKPRVEALLNSGRLPQMLFLQKRRHNACAIPQ